jgi:hypothetical protein
VCLWRNGGVGHYIYTRSYSGSDTDSEIVYSNVLTLYVLAIGLKLAGSSLTLIFFSYYDLLVWTSNGGHHIDD